MSALCFPPEISLLFILLPSSPFPPLSCVTFSTNIAHRHSPEGLGAFELVHLWLFGVLHWEFCGWKLVMCTGEESMLCISTSLPVPCDPVEGIPSLEGDHLDYGETIGLSNLSILP